MTPNFISGTKPSVEIMYTLDWNCFAFTSFQQQKICFRYFKFDGGQSETQPATFCVRCNSQLTRFCISCQLPHQQTLLNNIKQPPPSPLHSKPDLKLAPLGPASAAALTLSACSRPSLDAAGTRSAKEDGVPGTGHTVRANSLPGECVVKNSEEKEVPFPSVCDADSDADQTDTTEGGDGASMPQSLDSSSSKGQASSKPEPVMLLCPCCNLVLSSGDAHRAHVRSHDCLTDGEGLYKCSVCPKHFVQFDSFYNHIKLRADQQKCFECDQVFTSRCEINKHTRKHEKEKTRFCAKCNESFPSMSKRSFEAHMNKHLREQKGQPLALCPHCGKIFKKKEDLNNHMTYHNKDNPFPCTFPSCPKAFKNRTCLRQHLLGHGEKTQQCEVCGAKFFRKAGLRRHMQKHYGKQFCCEECPHRFCSNHDLKCHVEAVHKGIRKFSCSACDSKFHTSSSLKIHVRRIHTGEKPFQCEQCPAKFFLAAALRIHMRCHTGEKPYRCEDCEQVYSSEHSLKIHRKKLHSLYTCECGRTFTLRSSLDFHKKMCHDMECDVNPGAQAPQDKFAQNAVL